MNAKLNMNMLNCVLLVVVLSLVIMCCMKTNNESFQTKKDICNRHKNKLACKRDNNCLLNKKKKKCEGRQFIDKIADIYKFANTNSTSLSKRIQTGNFCSNFCSVDDNKKGYNPRLTTLRRAAAMNYNEKCGRDAILKKECNLGDAKNEFQRNICNYKTCREGCENFTKNHPSGRMTKNGKFVPNCYNNASGWFDDKWKTEKDKKLCRNKDDPRCIEVTSDWCTLQNELGEHLRANCPVKCNTPCHGNAGASGDVIYTPTASGTKTVMPTTPPRKTCKDAQGCSSAPPDFCTRQDGMGEIFREKCPNHCNTPCPT